MKLQKSVLIRSLTVLLLIGCMSNNIVMAEQVGRDKMVGQINVFGIELLSDVDYKEINGVAATEEPCLKGYDRSFDALDLTIGYGFDKKIRKITTRNSNTSIFGIRPGMDFEEGRKMILHAGFNEYVPPFTFRANSYSLKMLVNADNKIFGLTLELLDQ